MSSQTLRRLVVALATAAFLLSFFFHPLKPAYACSCVPARPPLEARDEAQAVFSGTVSQIAPAANGALVTFDVAQIWKGPEGSQLTLATTGSSASCGYEFAQGEQYLVYGLVQDGQLSTNLCTRTAPLANAGEDLAALGPGTAPPPAVAIPPAELDSGLPILPLAVAVAVGTGVVGALVALRRRRA